MRVEPLDDRNIHLMDLGFRGWQIASFADPITIAVEKNAVLASDGAPEMHQNPFSMGAPERQVMKFGLTCTVLFWVEASTQK